LNIKTTDHVVVYDSWTMNLFGLRAVWMFEAMGHTRVRALDGGFKKWEAEGRPCESTDNSVTEDDFAYKLNDEKYKDLGEMERITGGEDF